MCFSASRSSLPSLRTWISGHQQSVPTTSFKPGRAGVKGACCFMDSNLSVDRSLGPEKKVKEFIIYTRPKRKTNITILSGAWYTWLFCIIYFIVIITLHSTCPFIEGDVYVLLPSHSISSPNWKHYSPRNSEGNSRCPYRWHDSQHGWRLRNPSWMLHRKSKIKCMMAVKQPKLLGLQVK